MSSSTPASQKPMINMFSSFKSQHIQCGVCIQKPSLWETLNLHLKLLCSLVEKSLTFFIVLLYTQLCAPTMSCPTFPTCSTKFDKSKANPPCQNWNFQRNLRTKRRAGPPVKSSFRSTPKVGETMWKICEIWLMTHKSLNIVKYCTNIMRISKHISEISGFDLWWVEMPQMGCCDASSRVQT